MENRTPKTKRMSVTPVKTQLSDPSMEPLLRTDLHALNGADRVALEWSRLPVADQRYQLAEPLASGGMGTLYRATDTVLRRTVAIKALNWTRSDGPEVMARFLQEACIHAQFNNPGIPPLHDVGRLADGRPFLAMKLVRGRPLDDWTGPPPPGADRARAVFVPICRVVEYAHRKGVIHRDLTPRNVMVTDQGRVMVIDWGLAKVLPLARPGDGTMPVTVPNLVQTEIGAAIGTPAYMSPEAAGGAAVLTPLCDVFGLGGLLCYLLTGTPPFAGSMSDMMRLLRVGDLRPAIARLDRCDGPPELVTLAKACLSRNAAGRPQSVADVIQAAESPAADAGPRRSLLQRLFKRGKSD